MGLKSAIAFALRFMRRKPGDWMDKDPKATPAAATSPAGAFSRPSEYYNPDQELLADLSVPVLNPVLAGEANAIDPEKIEAAYLFEGIFDEAGRLCRNPRVIESKTGRRNAKPWRIAKYTGAQAAAKAEESAKTFKELPAKAQTARESKASLAKQLLERMREAVKKSKESGKPVKAVEDFTDDNWDGGLLQQYDPGQYTEYTPLYGGPYNRQLYISDYLKMAARAYQAWNHDPLAKRIINILAQYALGRGYKMVSSDDKVQEAWRKFEGDVKLRRKLYFWIREFLIFGELFIDKTVWQTIDPASVQDIITNVDNIEEVYYYHLMYQAPYQMFTGRKVDGVKNAEKQLATKYIIKDVPFDQVLHIKTECVSNEKRGRSVLFPVLGWLKRIRDLYNAKVIAEQLRAAFIYDDEVDGDQNDVNSWASTYASMPAPGSVFAHNKAVKRTAMPAVTGANQGDRTAGNEILAYIATSVGIPKDFLNLIAQGSGSRAGAIMGSEPFTKVVEDLQQMMEDLLHDICDLAMKQAGIDYDPEDVEFIFPSVTKDTTTETVANIQAGEAQGYIDKETAGNMYAAEMNITKYDFDDTQKKISDLKAQGLDQATGAPPTPGRFGANKLPPGQDPEGSPIHGDGAGELKDQLTTL